MSSAQCPSETGLTPKAIDKIKISKEAQNRIDSAREGDKYFKIKRLKKLLRFKNYNNLFKKTDIRLITTQ